MDVGSLFSGIGGIELGFRRAGFKTKWFIESDRYAREVLRKNFPGVPIYEDVTKVDFEAVSPVDILTGGFPCQDISYAGKGAGIEGSRSSLWKYYKKAIRILRPRYAVIENVPAIVKRGLNVVLSDLAEVGYDAEWYNISASSVGAFHKRERLFVIAYLPEQGNGGLSVQQGRSCEESVDVIRCSKDVFDPYNNGCSSSEKQRSSFKESEWSEERTVKAKQSKGPGPTRSDVADTNGTSAEYEIQAGRSVIAEGSDASNSNSVMCKRSVNERDRVGESKEKVGNGGMSENADSNKVGLWKHQSLQRDSFGFVTTESGVCGVVNGVPCRVDRIRCLGNAVVPQVAEVIAWAIKEQLGDIKGYDER